MKLNYFLFCDAAARSNQNKTILHGIFDEMFVREELSDEHPLVFPAMAMVFEIKDVDQKHSTVTLDITHEETGKNVFHEVLQNPTPDQMTKVIAGMRQLWMLNFPRLGKYRASLAVDDALFAETSLMVSRMTT